VSEERVLIVTGAAGGLGAATTRLLLERGARVVAVDLDESRVMAAVAPEPDGASDGRLACMGADVSSSGEVGRVVETTLERFGRLDALFNNAATLGPSLPIGDYSEEAFRRVLDVNVTGVWLLMKAALPELGETGGRIVNTASIAGLIGWSNLSGYTAAKHAVVGLTRAVAIEVGASGVTVNALCPGSTDTPMLWEGAEGLGVAPEEARRLLTSPIPAGRIADADEVADVAAWLLLDAPDYLTGAVIPVDGGQLAA
jgi:NAD(P)-dependent dehydrogenase (short-subunit alcohol dehydrogenase family)